MGLLHAGPEEPPRTGERPRTIVDRLDDLARRLRSTPPAVLERFALERLVDRISRSPFADAFELDGLHLAFAWTRPDPGDAPAALARAIRQVARVPPSPPDGVTFDPASVRVRPGARRPGAAPLRRVHGGARVGLVARIEGAGVPLRFDVAWRDPALPPRREVPYPTLLGGPAPRLRGTTLEARAATLLADLTALAAARAIVDALVELSEITWCHDLSGPPLVEALRDAIAAHHPAFPPADALHVPLVWLRDHAATRARWRRAARAAGLGHPPPPLTIALARLEAFGNPPLAAAGRPFRARWPPGGPWLRPDGTRFARRAP